MVQFGQSSFRRILLSRILLLSVPVLLIGEAVTYRKARTSLLETARKTMTESAARKAEGIQTSVRSLQANLLTASETSVLQSGPPAQVNQFVTQLQDRLQNRVDCLQLRDAQSGVLVSSTCGNQALQPLKGLPWPKNSQRMGDRPAIVPAAPSSTTPQTNSDQGKLHLILSTPVYSPNDQLRYVLSVRAVLHQWDNADPKSLVGYTMIVDAQGRILAHPNASRVGGNIYQEGGDADRFRSAMRNAQANQRSFVHLFSFQDDGREWLAGYSLATVWSSGDRPERWTVLAVTSLDDALSGLQDIQAVLVMLTLGLVAASLAATLYIARDLARPVEKLRDYALSVQQDIRSEPPRFSIREFSQLSAALQRMVKGLEDRAHELEAAWQEAQSANRLKNQFLANTSHELRTPLNAIIGCVRLVRDDCCDSREEELEFLQRADDAAIHLLRIINDLLDIAKIEAGTLSVNLEPVDLRQILREVVDLQSIHIDNKGLNLTMPALPEPVMVQADPAKLKQVLINVLYNAIKFTEQGGIHIDLHIEMPQNAAGADPETASAAIARGTWALLHIQDTGIGIDPTDQHKLFRPFVMVDGSTTRRFEGAGLGLAISRNLMELMGGAIALRSEGQGLGTTVEIALPMTAIADSEVTPDPAEAPRAESRER
ncbi:sensor histidine kinase [Geitlerinema sp. PCC 7407]|uniref:sensor histidine kinase n=1 Tax=Geitlerinema sp. PCC 7407 TaxID=1173025 RepID=UPI00029FDDFA|nr:sensor histidine kinase [Geitlerinema sp. PCC 7407]AFY65024.1 integral membrane sensor signal transduction histidine kinase [Geitlerinema sp. PCC 7407]